MSEKTWVKFTSIPEGRHLGEIFHLESRPVTKNGETFNYLDVKIRLNDLENQPEISYSVPDTQNISESSKLGRLLLLFGAKFEEGKTISPEAILIGKKCSVMIVEKPGVKDPKKMYSNIAEGSVKPI